MGEVIKLHATELQKFAADIENMVVSGELKSLYIAGEGEEGNIIIGSCNLNYGGKQRLIAELQVNVMQEVIEENYVTP